jgi:regulatory protein
MSKYDEALRYATSLCSDSEQCIKDILKKTEKFELNHSENKNLAQYLRSNGFIDENRYVKAFVNDSFKFNKWGKIKISYMLRQKDINFETIQEGLNSIDPDEYFDSLYKILTYKRNLLRSKTKEQLKSTLYRFAASKGFESNLTLKCLEKMNLSNDECD